LKNKISCRWQSSSLYKIYASKIGVGLILWINSRFKFFCDSV